MFKYLFCSLTILPNRPEPRGRYSNVISLPCCRGARTASSFTLSPSMVVEPHPTHVLPAQVCSLQLADVARRRGVTSVRERRPRCLLKQTRALCS